MKGTFRLLKIDTTAQPEGGGMVQRFEGSKVQRLEGSMVQGFKVTAGRNALLLLLLALFLSSCGGKSETSKETGHFDTGGESMRVFGIDISPDGSELYIANNIRGEVFILDSATLLSTAVFSLPYRPRYLELVPSENWLLATYDVEAVTEDGEAKNYQRFSILDTVNNTVSGTIELNEGRSEGGSESGAIAYAETAKKVYVANRTGYLSIIDLNQWTTSATATVTGLPDTKDISFVGLALSLDENTLYASDNVYRKIYVYDTATGTERLSFDLGLDCTTPTHLVLHESKDRLYAACTGSGRVGEVDTREESNLTLTTRLCRVIGTGTNPANMTPTSDMSYMFVSNQGSDNVSMIDLSNFTEVGTITAGDSPADIALYPPYLYVANVLGGSVTKASYSASSVSEYSQIKFAAGEGVAFSRDKDGSGGYGLYMMANDGGCVIPISTTSAYNTQPAWDNGLYNLVFVGGTSEADTSSYELYKAAVSDDEGYFKNTVTRLTNNSTMDAQPSVALKGSNVQNMIVYTCDPGGGDTEICSINMDGTDYRILTDNSVDDFHPSWFEYTYVGEETVEIEKIFFVRRQSDNNDIWMMDEYGNSQTQLTSTADQEMMPVPAYGQPRVVYVLSSSSNDPLSATTEIYYSDITITASGTVSGFGTPAALTGNAVMDTNPSWKLYSDSSIFYLSGEDESTGEVYEMTLDFNSSPPATQTNRITADTMNDRYPAAGKK